MQLPLLRVSNWGNGPVICKISHLPKVRVKKEKRAKNFITYLVQMFHQIFFDGIHALTVAPWHRLVVNDGCRIVFADDTTGLFLNFRWCLPRLVDVFHGHIGQLWNVTADVVTQGLHSLSKLGRVDADRTVQNLLECRTGDPHPVAGADREVSVQEVFVEQSKEWNQDELFFSVGSAHQSSPLDNIHK